MIVFQKLVVQNFLSVGNSPITVEYDKNKTTLVTATNGSGKSAIMLDALTFGLFGKPYRNINKPQLLNSFNGKQCLVEIHFKVNTTKYIIKRGLKPAIFEIYKSGKLLNQDAASRDYQKVLENSILKMNYRTFTQVIIMGSGNYTPFMRLRAQDRREFVEDVLDIKVFSMMNALLRDKTSDLKDKMKTLDADIKMYREKIQMQDEFIKTLEQEKDGRAKTLQTEIDKLLSEIEKFNGEIKELHETAETLQSNATKIHSLQGKISELKAIKSRLKKTIDLKNEGKAQYESLTVCPTCKQNVEDHHKHLMLLEVDSKIDELAKNSDDVDAKMNELMLVLDEVNRLHEEYMEITAKIGVIQSSVNSANRMVTKYQAEYTALMNNTSSVDTEKAKLKKLSKDALHAAKTKKAHNEDMFYHEVSAALLKDTGIKTKIIKQYIPIFNKLINGFLGKLDFFVSFNLDENFNEIIKARHREEFSYESFSEGEKQRVDLAILFAFREVSRMKNSLNCNLLILDEVLDQSLDAVGVDNFFSIIDSLPSSNLFVISHRENMQDKFDANIRFTKKNNFTVIDKIA